MVSVLSLDTNLRSLLPFVESTGKCITLSRVLNISFSKDIVCTDWLTDWLRYDCHSILYCMWEYFGAVSSGALRLFLSPMHMYCTLHLHCFMKCSRNGIFYCQYMWYYQYLSWARTISNFVTTAVCKSVCFSDKSCFGLFCILIRRCKRRCEIKEVCFHKICHCVDSFNSEM